MGLYHKWLLVWGLFYIFPNKKEEEEEEEEDSKPNSAELRSILHFHYIYYDIAISIDDNFSKSGMACFPRNRRDDKWNSVQRVFKLLSDKMFDEL